MDPQSPVISTVNACPQPRQPALTEHLHAQVLKTIETSRSFPGYSDEVFAKLKPELIESWNTLVQKGVLEVTKTDQEVRPCFVTLQAIVEQVLSQNLGTTIGSLLGVIHTPMPATPLCTKEDTVSPGLVHPSIQEDPARLATVKARATIVRDFLRRGGDLYIAYPEKGLGERKPDMQAIYQAELKTFSHPKHLYDQPLKCQEIQRELHGALYFFKSKEGEPLVFGIKMTQAIDPKDPKEVGSFGLWMGSMQHPAVKERVGLVMDFVQRHTDRPIPM